MPIALAIYLSRSSRSIVDTKALFGVIVCQGVVF